MAAYLPGAVGEADKQSRLQFTCIYLKACADSQPELSGKVNQHHCASFT